jgi:cobalt-zinc-cadmium efflux system outer membrane protein
MDRFYFAVPLLLSACASQDWKEDLDRLRDVTAALPVVSESAPRAPSSDADLDKQLAGPLDLATLVRIARTRNPELREASALTRAAIENVAGRRSLDDPIFKLETEGVPLSHPGSLGMAQDNMAGLSQSFPFPGNLSLRGEAAARDAEGQHQRYLDRERDVILRLKRAYLDYYAAVRAIETHDSHLKLMEATEKISDAKFRTGAVSQQDVLKPQLEQVLLHNEVLSMGQMKGSAQAQINMLLHRPAEAPLGEPQEIAAPDETFDLRELAARAAESRPDLKAAELRVKSSQAALRLAERERDLPDFSVGVDYWQIPGGPDAYGAMLSINLPWFTGKRSADARRLEQMLRADEAALDTVRGRVQYEIRDAWLRVDAARRSAALFRGELLPKTAQTVEVSRASYEKDKSSFLDLLDSERSLRDVRLKHIQAVTNYELAVADLERAVGADLRRKP